MCEAEGVLCQHPVGQHLRRWHRPVSGHPRWHGVWRPQLGGVPQHAPAYCAGAHRRGAGAAGFLVGSGRGAPAPGAAGNQRRWHGAVQRCPPQSAHLDLPDRADHPCHPARWVGAAAARACTAVAFMASLQLASQPTQFSNLWLCLGRPAIPQVWPAPACSGARKLPPAAWHTAQLAPASSWCCWRLRA